MARRATGRKTTSRNATGRARRRPKRVVLNPRRSIVLALLTVAALGLGYLALVLMRGDDERVGTVAIAPPSAPASAWYKSQPPPPSLVRGPDAPILPEPNGETPARESRRAYEEALPVDVYVAPPATGVSEPAKTEAVIPAAPSAEPELAADTAAWRQYALAMPETNGRPMIAIVIDDMGLDRKRTARISGLPGPLTLSFLTYAEELGQQTRAARVAGHELMLHVGMEPGSKTVDPGPNVLLAGDAPDEIRRRLIWGLGRFTGFVGVNNHMGSKFTESREGMAVVMAELKARGLLFLDSRTTPRSVGAELARQLGVPAVERNVFLDNENDVAAVNARLAEVERLARRTGTAIAIGHPRDATLAALAQWIPALEAKGFVLVPLTAIVRAAIEGEETG